MHHQSIGFPNFWHKNYALVCEKLLHVEHSIPKEQLADQAVAHFHTYLDLADDDDDAEKILDAIRIIQERKKMYERLQAANKNAEKTADRLGKLGKGN